jgi:hypothetical protein
VTRLVLLALLANVVSAQLTLGDSTFKPPFLLFQQSGKTDSLLQVIIQQNDSLLQVARAKAEAPPTDGFISHDTARWIFSALVQAFAVLMALAGLFAIFKLQLLAARKTETDAGLKHAWQDTNDSLILHTTGDLQSKVDTRRMQSHEDYIEYMRPILSQLAAGPVAGRDGWARGRLDWLDRLYREATACETDRRTCKSLTILTAVLNGVVVALGIAGLVMVDAMGRLARITSVTGVSLLSVAALTVTVWAIVRILKLDSAAPRPRPLT